MTTRERWLALMLVVAGIGVCITTVITFLAGMVNNELPWRPNQSVQEHYMAVGRSFGDGFAAGFFLCFFLALGVVTLHSWIQHRRGFREPRDGTRSATMLNRCNLAGERNAS